MRSSDSTKRASKPISDMASAGVISPKRFAISSRALPSSPTARVTELARSLTYKCGHGVDLVHGMPRSPGGLSSLGLHVDKEAPATGAPASQRCAAARDPPLSTHSPKTQAVPQAHLCPPCLPSPAGRRVSPRSIPRPPTKTPETTRQRSPCRLLPRC
eukprot:scaffold134689_cov27-Tisochrysis_lutea.AAC.3